MFALKHKKEQLNRPEEIFEKGKSEHTFTKGELEECTEQVKTQNRIMSERILELEHQRQQAAEESEYIQENHVTEMSGLQLQNTLEDLDQAKCENKIM